MFFLFMTIKRYGFECPISKSQSKYKNLIMNSCQQLSKYNESCRVIMKFNLIYLQTNLKYTPFTWIGD